MYLGLGPLSRLPGQVRLSLADQNIVLWGGARGAVAIALALSLSTGIPYWYTIQSMVYGVALFGMAVQTPLVGGLLRRRSSIETQGSSAPSSTAQTLSRRRG